MKIKKIIKNHIEYFFLFYLVKFFNLFPLRIALKIAEYIGRLLFHLDKKHRQRALDNLTFAFSEKSYSEIKDICRKVYINSAKIFMEFIFLPKIDKDFVKRNVKIVGEENLKKGLKLNKGIIGITGHIGNWELLGAILVKSGYGLSAVYHPMRNPLSDKLFYQLRYESGMELISMKNSLKGSIKALKENRILGLIADQDAGGSGVFVNFFNRPASTAKGPAVFAIKTGAPMIIFTLIREKGDRFTLYIDEPLKVRRSGNLEDDILYNTKLWSDELEKWVRKYPEQWFWVHRKWHTKPKL